MIQLPPSKSIGARFMVASYFSGTLPADPIFDDNDDLMTLQEALLEIYSDEEPIDYGDSPIDVGASGTALRFVTAVCASSPGADYVITGSPRLMERPMTDLLDLLRDAGAGVECLGENGAGPYRVTGKKLEGGEFSIRGDISSQFISALMLVAPSWKKGLKLNFTTPPVSKPYIEMTAALMKEFGMKVNLTDNFVEVEAGEYHVSPEFQVESDWSSASFFYEACALGAENVEIAGLKSPSKSIQGDSFTADLFSRIGVVSKFGIKSVSLKEDKEITQKIEINFKDCPDLVLPFSVACLMNDIKFLFTGVSHLRLKESDRIKSLCKEALKLGFVLKQDEESISWDGDKTQPESDPVIDTYDDHRVAMSFAMVPVKTGAIRISHPEVVEKSFNDFWNQLPKIGMECTQEGDIMKVTYKP